MMPKVEAFSIQTLLPSFILTTRELPGVAQLYIQMGKSLRETATHSNTDNIKIALFPNIRPGHGSN